MRTAFLILTLCLVGACADGVVIEVHSDAVPGVTHVELFLAHAQLCDTPPCDSSIQPEGELAPLPGTIYSRDSAPRFTEHTDARGVAKFRLESGTADTQVPLLVAVGLDDHEKPIAAALVDRPVDPVSPMRLVVDLVPASTHLGSHGSVEEHVKIWAEAQADASSCLAYERWSGNELVVRKFIVPADDPDCDDKRGETPQCEMVYGDGTVVPPAVDKPCLAPPLDAPGACALGTFGGRAPCADADAACTGGELCVPDSACDRCGADTLQGSTKLLACLLDTRANADTTTFVCTLPVKLKDGNGPLVVCPSASGDSYQYEFHDSFTEEGCRDPEFIKFAPGTMTPLPPTTNQTTFEVRTVGAKVALTVTPGDSNEQTGCVLGMKFEGQLVASSVAALSFDPVFMKIARGDGQHEIGFPMKIQAVLQPDCQGSTMLCRFETTNSATMPDDAMFTCVP